MVRSIVLCVALGVCLAVPGLAAPRTLRVLIVACTAYRSAGNNVVRAGCEQDLTVWRGLFEGARQNNAWGVPSTIEVLEGAAATSDRILEAFRRMAGSVAEDDTLLVLYTGHGGIDAATGAPFLLAVDERPVDRRTLADGMRALGCKLKILITNCCSTFCNFPLEPVGGPAPEPEPLNDRKLLLGHHGFTDLTAASPGQAAWTTDQGSFFLRCLHMRMEGSATWEELFRTARDCTESDARAQTRELQRPVAHSLAEPDAAAGPAPAPAAGRPVYHVTGVPAGKTLRIRARPDLKGEEVGAIPAGARDVTGTGDRSGEWIGVVRGGRRGWVHGGYLTPVGPAVEAGSAWSGRRGASFPALTYRVCNVTPGSRLNVRNQALILPNDTIKDRLGHDARGLVHVQGPDSGFVKIQYTHPGGRVVEGWVSTGFVTPE